MKNTRSDRFDGFYTGLTEWVRAGQGDNGEALERLRKNLPRAVIEELTPMQAEMVIQHFYEGKSMRQIAKERGVNESTVSRTIARAKKRLERCLKYNF